jgi:hypothetical protein
MTQSDYTVRVLTASDGCFLTEADSSLDVTARTITNRVYLAATDFPDRWREISASDADAYNKARQEAEAERQEQQRLAAEQPEANATSEQPAPTTAE